jgi:hypothetical protein
VGILNEDSQFMEGTRVKLFLPLLGFTKLATEGTGIYGEDCEFMRYWKIYVSIGKIKTKKEITCRKNAEK